nr:hypothetical protein Q903MT_gene1377 [Picea sitchensis]
MQFILILLLTGITMRTRMNLTAEAPPDSDSKSESGAPDRDEIKI